MLETVDHFNRDKTDDRIDNLKVKLRSQHAKEDKKRVKPINIVCIWCGVTASKDAHDLAGNEKQGKAGPFCSRICSGSYGSAIQNGCVEKLDRTPTPQREYYYFVKD